MFTETDFTAPKTTSLPDVFRSHWSAPSNIALVKYWGKRHNQLPANPSVSFTLDHCRTITSVDFHRSGNHGFDLQFEGKQKEGFRPKIEKFIERILPYCPYLSEYHLTIDTRNTFPHSSGIASSASGMAALATNIISLEKQIFPEMSREQFFTKASFLARLGSGSACRSIAGQIVVWGNHSRIPGSSDFYGVPYQGVVHPDFKHFRDTILLVDKGEKQVSSTVGHELMHNHAFAPQRFAQAHENITSLTAAMESGDMERFVAIVESEALTLHAMMMTSMPYFILMRPNTLEIINRVWRFRRETNIPVSFTLDAGANVHLLYRDSDADAVLELITNELVTFCQNDHYICDTIGSGASEIFQSN